ncbi:PREDICTED: zona pellucida sperm-binding protein 1 [Chrysochloris asiatica]|uniref:Zona pellucida sperm-binding protein 1 n=1 Tax=Chrysochloris asiatica TaxID=185453 RepID=A0A9B0X1H2_CHRAS|nr:PREDICTED: zona pellucida sperm-binding protein 1 [Chrysochloris asiatica]
MAWGRCAVLLLLVVVAAAVAATLEPGLGQQTQTEPGLTGLRHSYNCGAQNMQLWVLPRPGRAVRFKVVDEFGNRFDVNNCSICYHWITFKPQGAVVFSADYKGCHVLEKDGHSYLTVVVEALLPDGRVEATQDATLICPKPDGSWTLDSHLVPPTLSSLSPPHSPALSPSPGPNHAFPSPLYPDHSSIPLTPASSSWGPGPTDSSLAPSQQSMLGHGDVDKSAYIGNYLTQEQCRVASGHIPCTVMRNSKEGCQQAGCCYDNTREIPCYYGNTATVQCFRDGNLILVVSQETALVHRITLANVYLAYAPTSCPPSQKTDAFVVFRFPLTHCGTTAQIVGNQLIYENQLVSDMDIRMGPRGSVTWDGAFRLHVRCVFNASDFLPIQASIFPPPPPGPLHQSGPLRLELRIAKDKTFSSFYGEDDYPISKLLREPVHVEVRLLQRADPSLALMLHQCWATPGPNPFQQPQWPILSDGCPFDSDGYRTEMVASDQTLPFPAHHQRFTVATFTFLDRGSHKALRGPVYFFCSSSVCHPSELETCSMSCSPGTARRRRFSGDHNNTARPWDIVSSPGPVGFEDVSGQLPTQGPTGSMRNSSSELLWVVLLLLAVVLFLGVGILVGLSQAWARKLQKGSKG